MQLDIPIDAKITKVTITKLHIGFEMYAGEQPAIAHSIASDVDITIPII